MRTTPGAARAYILCAVVCAVVCARSALFPGATTPWGTLGLLAALYLACELPGRCPFFGGSVPVSAGSFFPLLLAAAFLLPPAAAVLVSVPGSLAGRVEQPPATARRVWRAAQLALTVGAASWTYASLGVRRPSAVPTAGPSPISRTPCSPPAPRRSSSVPSWLPWTAASSPRPSVSPSGTPGGGCWRVPWDRTWCTRSPG